MMVQLITVIDCISTRDFCYLKCFPPPSTIQYQEQTNSTKQAANSNCKQYTCNDSNRSRTIGQWAGEVKIGSYSWSCSFRSIECRIEINGGSGSHSRTWDWIQIYCNIVGAIEERKYRSALVIMKPLQLRYEMVVLGTGGVH